MANIPAFVPVRGEIILPITAEAKGRVGQGYSVLDGLSGAEQGTPDMTVAIAAGTVRLAHFPKSISAGNATIDAHHDTLGRKDIIYIDANGAIAVWKGDDLAVVDPQGNGLWTEYTSPYPKAGCPVGVPLYEVYIAPGAEHIHSTDLRSIAQYDPLPRGPWTLPPVRVTHDGGASQAILTSPALCEIKEILVKCIEAGATRTVNIGWAADPDAIMADADMPKLLNGVAVGRFPISELTAATAIIATVGGSGNGEWDVYLEIARYA
jgi:hypothetical protein